jgi:hypothetical protein
VSILPQARFTQQLRPNEGEIRTETHVWLRVKCPSFFLSDDQQVSRKLPNNNLKSLSHSFVTCWQTDRHTEALL